MSTPNEPAALPQSPGRDRVTPDATSDAPSRVALACLYCDGKLTVNTETTGRPYMTYEVPESIECLNCGADWEPDGTARTAAKWIEWPDLYRDRPRRRMMPDLTPANPPAAPGPDTEETR